MLPATMTPSSPTDGARNGSSAIAKRAARGPRKQRILWDSDNATPDGKTSIGVLLEWLTTPGNYARWCDGKGQAGETREKLCSEINAALRSHGILHRENANIRTQISELERAFDAAVMWLVDQGFGGRLPPATEDASTAAAAGAVAGAGAGDGDNGGHATANKTPRGVAEAHVQRLCRYFHVLYPVMSQMTSQPRTRRPYSRLSLGERRPSASTADDGDGSGNETTSEHGGATGATATATTNATTAATAAGVVSRKRRTPTSETMPPSFAQFEQAQRLFLEAAREEREAKRLRLDEERNKLECEKLRYEVEAKRLELVVQRALARKRLLDAGLSADEVDAILLEQQQEQSSETAADEPSTTTQEDETELADVPAPAPSAEQDREQEESNWADASASS
ncbi:hypothetical protein ATCC90586_003562 [Pythium insidiosum]|nr:hypothetical protein ATCC90586_003562 [Pythium insidiosum]